MPQMMTNVWGCGMSGYSKAGICESALEKDSD